jgi:hypothetical protein
MEQHILITILKTTIAIPILTVPTVVCSVRGRVGVNFETQALSQYICSKIIVMPAAIPIYPMNLGEYTESLKIEIINIMQ